MSYCVDNRDKILKKHMIDIITKEEKKKQPNIIEKMQIYYGMEQI